MIAHVISTIVTEPVKSNHATSFIIEKDLPNSCPCVTGGWARLYFLPSRNIQVKAKQKPKKGNAYDLIPFLMAVADFSMRGICDVRPTFFMAP